jgi:hypothetical protein
MGFNRLERRRQDSSEDQQGLASVFEHTQQTKHDKWFFYPSFCPVCCDVQNEAMRKAQACARFGNVHWSFVKQTGRYFPNLHFLPRTHGHHPVPLTHLYSRVDTK